VITKDWIADAVQKINDEYPRVLRDCNDQTPLPWLFAVIREACPFKPDVAYMPVPQCETCANYRTSLLHKPNEGYCDMLVSFVTADFGCVRWEAK
jgi:hypothetical protein